MSNQSSVEWLYQEFERIDKEFHVGSHEYNNAKKLALKTSKAMHSQEIIDAYHTNPLESKWQNKGFGYYNETFGCNNEQQ